MIIGAVCYLQVHCAIFVYFWIYPVFILQRKQNVVDSDETKNL